ncbi:IKI3 family-domain-containing protein [Amylostereum chailletii]|nr:IKI3 family-domain-containing protein [Amylostereum chailletii]
MRNVILSKSQNTHLADAHVTATVVDVEDDSLWIASERLNPDADVEIELWKRKGADISHKVEEEAIPTLVTMFTSTTNHSVSDSTTQIASLRNNSDERLLVIVTRGGDIASMGLDDEEPKVEVVGSIEEGILAAAWSPDDTILVLVTGDGKLILMTPTFDVLSEAPLHTEKFGEDAPINVGWGSKQTQFHGSLGKAAAQVTQPSTSTSVGSSPDDDSLPRISWRGDGALFVVSSLTPAPPASAPDTLQRRVLRVFDREGALQSTSEPVPGLEHVVSWRPSGNLIVGTQRFGKFKGAGQGKEGRHDVVFFERNGLRHGEFALREYAYQRSVYNSTSPTYKVNELCWSPDSNILAVWIETVEGDIVQLWTTGNYHWYLKQELRAPARGGKPGRLTSVGWHPEAAMQLLLTMRGSLIQHAFAWDTCVARTSFPKDTATVAVVDGTNILLTPFRTQNVPPPMSSFQLAIQPSAAISKRTPVHMSFTALEDILAVLWDSGFVELWRLHTRTGPGRTPVMAPEKMFGGTLGEVSSTPDFREVAVWASEASAGQDVSTRVAILGRTPSGSDVVQVTTVDKGQSARSSSLNLEGRGWKLVLSSPEPTVHHLGKVYQVKSDPSDLVLLAELGRPCEVVHFVSHPTSDRAGFIGLTSSGVLLFSVSPSSRTLASNVNSVTVSSGLIIYTTTAHEAYFIALEDVLKSDIIAEIPSERRRVERGSRIVTGVPSNMSLVLQMPRGNLETINPRPMVLKVVRDDIDAGNWLKAFLACRKHRIDLNILVDHSPALFRQKLPSFVEQINDVDHINLFLTTLGRGSQPPETISELCDAVREELEKVDLKRYVNSILTAYVAKQPPDHEAGLRMLLHIRESDPTIVEEAVKYIIFLVDANTLFDIALGMYDFSLVLMIAQYAQKDPREYLPFLRELRALETHYQHFRIDDYLKKPESALQNLSLAGQGHFEEALTYIEKHRLYDSALRIWRGKIEYPRVLTTYGEWLYEHREFKQSAIAFVEASQPQKALVAYEKALLWRELFDLAVREETSEEDLVTVAYRVAEDLTSKKRYSEGSQVLLDYAKDVREAVVTLVQGNQFSEARRVATLRSRPELLEEIIQPGTLETRAQISEDLNEMREQLRKQVLRVNELRIRKVEEPEAFYGVEDTDLHNVDVMTDASQFTAFTRYTVAPSTASRTTSKRSSRSKRKLERKVGSGRKGTVDEEEYLLKSLTKLAARFSTTQDEASSLVPHLLQLTDEHRAEARELQDELAAFEKELAEAIAQVWPMAPGEVEGEEPQDSWAQRMEEREKEREQAVKAVVKPSLRSSSEWRTKLLDVGQ